MSDINTGADFFQRSVKRRKLSPAVYDPKTPKNHVRWAELNAVIILPSTKRTLGMRIHPELGPPAPMRPPAPIDGFGWGKVKRHTDMGVPINEAPPVMYREGLRERRKTRRREAKAKLVVSQPTSRTVGPVANAESDDVPHGDGVQEEVQEEEVRTEEEGVHAQKGDDNEQEESFVSSLLETLSPTLQQNDGESSDEPEEISLDA